MKKLPVILIFDIGKTNKKYFLIDESYGIVLEQSEQFAETLDEDGDNCENVTLLTNWVIDTLNAALKLDKYNILAINFSAYGASLVYIDKDGKVIAPLYNYLKKYPEALMGGLYNKYGGTDKISCETASPVLGSLNSGMQLYRVMREQPDLYQAMKYALHLPQYISYLISRNACSDITSIGCHTQLWNFQQNKYHEWVMKEGLDSKLAPLADANTASEYKFNDRKLFVGTGLHDSSAALIPYLAVFKEPFILLSTGTWCISLNPFNETPLTLEELKQDCLCYMEYQGRPVKASRLFAGYEHERQVKRLAAHYNTAEDFYKTIKYDGQCIATLKKDQSRQTSFSLTDLHDLPDYATAYHKLMLDIINQQFQSTQLVIHGSSVHRIFVDGGFSNNTIYMHLLAAVFPNMEIYAASVAQATAMGAALAIHDYWNKFPVPADMVKLKYYTVTDTVPIPTN